MKRVCFPPVHTADEHGLLAIGGDLAVDTLLEAYTHGIFPWPIGPEYPLTWFSPPKRGVLFFKDLHISRSLQKFLRNCSWEIRSDTAFSAVITACAALENRRDTGTWITQAMRDAYIRLHEAGYAHSVECFEGEELIGGLYGVAVGGMFAGESMFYRRTHASKVCLIALVRHLQTEGCEWLDCQQATPLFQRFGAVEIPREEFLKLLSEAICRPALSFPFPTVRFQE